jgi:glycosyltransferase involved in cell wall biosynthesis
MIQRDSSLLTALQWHTRYHLEQMSAVLPCVVALRRRRIQIAFCADPSLAWNLKRFRRWHGSKVFFSDGMRLSPRWLQSYDGIHLLAPVYLEEAKAAVHPERFDRFFSIPYFADTSLFHPGTTEERDALRRALGIPYDHRVALSVGPVGTESSKRLDHVAQELAASGTDRWTLLSAGADETGAAQVRARCEAALGHRIRFLGSQPREKLKDLFLASDIYALGALAEPFSIAIIEAMACGLPVIHHRFPVTEWITGGAGIAVDMSEPGNAAEAFARFAGGDDPEGRRRATALELTASRYAPRIVTEQLVAQFRAALLKP